MRSETAVRLLVAAIGIPVALLVIYLGGWWLTLLVAVVAGLAAREFYQLARAVGARPLQLPGVVMAVGAVLIAGVGFAAGGIGVWLILTTLVMAAGVIGARKPEEGPLLAAAATVFGAAYTGGLLAYAVLLRHLPGIESSLHGASLLFLPVLLTWVNDSAAYFGGRRFGRNKLIPSVSPGKTVEGSVAGITATVLVALPYAFWLEQFPTYRVSLPVALGLGLLVAVAAQVGDLVESLLKRDAGVKDSGTLLPGHGGALDRFDALLFTIPLAYFFFFYLVGP